MLYCGNADILTLAELLIGGKHSHTVLDCFLTLRDNKGLREQLQPKTDRRSARNKVSVLSPVEEATRGYWEIDSVAMMLGDCVMAHRLSAPTPTGRAFTSATSIPSLLHRAYLQQMLLSSPNANVLGSLLQAGANPSAKDVKGWTPDQAAGGNHEVLHRFANGAILLP
eukprot:COSAG02_NODE_2094_length_9849_cov_9.775282_5_plen_168_part_00